MISNFSHWRQFWPTPASLKNGRPLFGRLFIFNCSSTFLLAVNHHYLVVHDRIKRPFFSWLYNWPVIIVIICVQLCTVTHEIWSTSFRVCTVNWELVWPFYVLHIWKAKELERCIIPLQSPNHAIVTLNKRSEVQASSTTRLHIIKLQCMYIS